MRETSIAFFEQFTFEQLQYALAACFDPKIYKDLEDANSALIAVVYDSKLCNELTEYLYPVSTY